jgi:hypothetical protein
MTNDNDFAETRRSRALAHDGGMGAPAHAQKRNMTRRRRRRRRTAHAPSP